MAIFVVYKRFDRPRAKALAVPLASRRGSKSARQQKNSTDLDLALNAKPDRPNSGCCLALLSTVPQIRYGASGRKPAQTRQKKNLDFFWVESTEAQSRATDRHREAPTRLDSNTPKNGHFSAGGSVHRPWSAESCGLGTPRSRGCYRKGGALLRFCVVSGAEDQVRD